MTLIDPAMSALDRARVKAYLRLIPILFACYVIAYVDRTNVSIAKLTMSKDMPAFNNDVIGTGAGIFFLGYFLLEVPGTLLVELWSARKWISRIMISWGIVAALTAFVHHRVGGLTDAIDAAGRFAGVVIGPQRFELAELLGFPVVTTLMARGVFPDSHPQHLGMPGMHGTVPAVLALQESDLLITIGARFDDRVTGRVAYFAPEAKVIHADIDPAEIGKIRAADVPIVGDAAEVISDLIAAVSSLRHAQEFANLEAWWHVLDGWREKYPLGYQPTSDGLLSPQYAIQRIGELTGPEGVYAAGVGQHQMWAAQFIKYERPNSWLNSGGAGTMGYAVPAAMGAKVAEPDRVVWAIDGDGCFQMTNQELATCVINNIPIKVAVINNSSLGMVRQWQTLIYDGRYSNTELNTGHGSQRIPDFVKLGDAYGCLSLRVEREDQVDDAIKLALETNDRPVLIEFVVSADAMVWPMVRQGTSNSDIQYALEHSPKWEEE